MNLSKLLLRAPDKLLEFAKIGPAVTTSDESVIKIATVLHDQLWKPSSRLVSSLDTIKMCADSITRRTKIEDHGPRSTAAMTMAKHYEDFSDAVGSLVAFLKRYVFAIYLVPILDTHT